MPGLPIIRANQLIRALEKANFRQTRQRGSHVRLWHEDGRVVTVPVHSGQDIGRGLLRKILRDADLTVDELLELLR
jgi:predicted RNA binding protein YcfA (HicA-like mRNA interferase family)